MKLFFAFLLLFIGITTQNHRVNAEDYLDEVFLLYAEVPETWENPHVWAFTESGTPAYGELGWPGKAMAADANNPGWYYLYIPIEMDQVIINANSGTVQTDDFGVTDEDLWVTVTEDDDSVEVIISTETLTVGDAPEYIPTQFVFAYVPIDWDTAGVWAWQHPEGINAYSDWPGVEMTLLDDGWFRMEVPRFVNRVIINNFSMSDGQQTQDLEIGNETVYILVDEEPLEDGQFAAEIFDSKPTILGESVTILIDAPAHWETPHVWSWSHPDGTNVYPNWPGEPAEFDEEEDQFFVNLPIWANRIIINNGIEGADGEQTVDVELLGGDDTIVVGEIEDSGQYSAVMVSSVDEETPAPDPTPEPEPEPEPTPEPTPSTDEDSNLGLLIGLIAGGVVIIGGAALFLLKRN